MKAYYLLVLCLSFISGCYSFREIFNGRPRGGFLGLPGGGDSLFPFTNKREEWITQKLDHFNTSDKRNWKQRYFVNDAFISKSRNVAFLNMEGEAEADPIWVENGSWVEYAKSFGAICFQLEHRYYGQSRPTQDISTKNLRYLTSQQALKDTANFIQVMTAKYNLSADVKWIAFGASYSAALSAWLKLKYPNLVHGVISSSAPVLAKLNFKEYFQVVADDLRATSPSCLTAVQTGFASIGTMLGQPAGQKTVDRLFHLCTPIADSLNNADDMANFYDYLATNFAAVAQYNLDNRLPDGRSNITLKVVCDIMTNETIGTEVQRLAAVNDLYPVDCLDYNYDNMISYFRNDTWDADAAGGSRQFLYQTCVELGYFQTSDATPHVFSDKFPLKFNLDQCRDIFGAEYTQTYIDKRINSTNNLYGGLNINVSNVVFVHGSIDPWSKLGITKTRVQTSPAIFIKGAAHCSEFYPSTDDDLPTVKAARVQIRKIIASWLGV